MAFKMYNKVLCYLFVHLLLCLSVDSYCWMKQANPMPGEQGTSCEYNGWRFENGSSFESPAPFCERCSCSSQGLGCCGYGRKAGIGSVQGCRQVIDENSCDVKFVDIHDESQPCNGWKK